MPPYRAMAMVAWIGAAVFGAPAAAQVSNAPADSPEAAARRAADDTFVFALDLNSGTDLYYVVENQFRDSGGVPPYLAYSTSIRDKRTIAQRILKRAPQSDGDMKPPSNTPVFVVIWKCDRYEAQEKGMKDRVSFDSLRDLFPPPSLYELGGIPGSEVSFVLDPQTARAQRWNILPGKIAGAGTRKGLSTTASRCALNEENLQNLADAVGPFWMPARPVRVGDQWTHRLTEKTRNFGTIITDVSCTFKSLRRDGDAQIAFVDISGQSRLQPPPAPATQPARPAASQATTRPAQRATTTSAPAKPAPTTRPAARTQSTKTFRLEKSVCSGAVEFDLTHGRLVQLVLRRETGVVADIETPGKKDKMQLRSENGHLLKVKASTTPPPKPVIIGGPKPPKVDPEDLKGVRPEAPGPNLRKRPILRPGGTSTNPTEEQPPPPEESQPR